MKKSFSIIVLCFIASCATTPRVLDTIFIDEPPEIIAQRIFKSADACWSRSIGVYLVVAYTPVVEVINRIALEGIYIEAIHHHPLKVLDSINTNGNKVNQRILVSSHESGSKVEVFNLPDTIGGSNRLRNQAKKWANGDSECS